MVVVVVATIFALAWMSYRVSNLLHIPIPTLVKLLGLDLPCPPRVSLHGISADTITLHWSLPEKAGSVAKHIIQINGINVGESEKRGETSVTVTGLNPDQRYNVRVIAANSQNFQAPGQLIRLRTRRKSQATPESQASKLGDSSDDAPVIQSSVTEVPASPQHHHHAHHHHHHHHNSRRNTRERRGSPAALEQHQHHHVGASTPNDQHTVESLTRNLDAVRKEIQEMEGQLAHIEEEYKAAEIVLRGELDTLKDRKNEEDAGRQRLRAETKSLEEARRTAEATRTRTEKALRAKQHEIKKMHDDMARWEDERLAALEKVDELSRAAEESKENAATTEKEYSDDIRATQSNIAEMEEEIRKLVGSLKALENHKEQLRVEEEEEKRLEKEEVEREGIWKEQEAGLEMRYLTAFNACAAAEAEYKRSVDTVSAFQRRDGHSVEMIPPPKKPKQRRNRNRKSRQVSSPINSYPLQDARFPDTAAFSAGHLQQSPTFSNSAMATPFFNIANGAVTGPSDLPDIMTGPILDPDRITGGAPMSPTANALLPSNLFGYDEDSPPSPKASSPLQEGLQHNSTPDFMAFMAPQQPQSPMSSGSVSTSPRSSFNHIPLFPSLSAEATTLPSERPASIATIGSHRQPGNSVGEEAPSNGRRFVKLFSNSFNRQRGKTLPLDPGPLGSLKLSESHSFPKNDPPGLDPIGTRRRSGSYGSWTSIPDFLHTSRGKRPLDRTSSDSSRRSAFNQFHPSFDPIDPLKLLEGAAPVSPRPNSIASFDNLLPAPSEEVGAAFGWPAEPPRNPGLPGLGAHWGEFGPISQSRPVSRPISPVNTSTASLSLLPSQVQPPPGFGPSANSTRPVTPRLNPAAPTFQSRQNLTSAVPTASSPITAKEDARSIHSTTSTVDSGAAASMDSATATNSKESILSRFSLSRKGSTGKFTGFFRKKGDEDTPLVDEEGLPGSASSPVKSSLWSSWKKDGETIEYREAGKDEEERDGRVTPATTPLAKESSPWIKGGKDGFFGTIGRKRGEVKKENGEEKEKESGWESDNSVVVGGGKDKEKKKEGLGIFRRRRGAGGDGSIVGSADES